ncbi:MAG: EF-P lysine aminoacylase GenX [Rhodospirillales bacterium]|nr:MAG: EF-P lysine aminoacylase GenX [Rhodospirillales bacterium]
MSPAPSWHPDVFARRRPYLEARGRITRTVRDWFAAQDFMEVETSCLQVSPGLEPHLKAFQTSLSEPFGEAQSPVYLHTSPEFAMKKLLAAGIPRLFQLARCFRNEERSVTHHPEFTMLEWYRADAGLDDLMTDCEDLVKAALQASGQTLFSWQGKTCDPMLPWQRLTVAEAFERYAGIDLMGTLSDADEPDPRPLAELARNAGLYPQPEDRWEDVFFRIFLERVEPQLGVNVPTFLTGYPLCMAALSKQDPNDPRLASRFELYIAGLELANAFQELTDSNEQRRRFERDQSLKRKLYGDIYPIDEDFLSAVSHMPECAGIALGFDRLVMLAAQAACIEDVLWLPVSQG